MILGKNLIVSINGTPVAAAKSCTLSVSQDFIQACSPTQGRVMTKIPTTYDWSMSVNGLIGSVLNPQGLIEMLREGEKVFLSFQYNSTDTYHRCAGYAYVKSCELGGSIGNLATFSANFESTGVLYTRHSSHNVAAFTEGEEKYFIISDGKPSYGNDRHDYLCGVQITLPRESLLLIYSDNPYVIYNASFSDVKNAISLGTTDSLESSIIAAKEAELTSVILQPGTYTVLESVDYQSQPEISIDQWREY